MNPKVYATNHQHSRVICAAMAAGCGGSIVPPIRLLDGPAVMYGILRGTGDIIKQCQWVDRPYYYIDHGYFGRGHYDGYYRVTRNGYQVVPEFHDPSPRRFQALKIDMRPWSRSGKHIVVCPISPAFGEFLGINHELWTALIVEELSRYTDRPILVKPKDGQSLSKALKGAWCLVTHSSNAAVDAIMSGIPSVVLGESAAAAVSWRMGDIEKPWWPEREPWAWELANNQWTLEEMRSGKCWEDLNASS